MSCDRKSEVERLVDARMNERLADIRKGAQAVSESNQDILDLYEALARRVDELEGREAERIYSEHVRGCSQCAAAQMGAKNLRDRDQGDFCAEGSRAHAAAAQWNRPKTSPVDPEAP